MGITRDSRHKHRQSGGRTPIHQKKRKFELGRPSAMTKLGAKRVRAVRCYGGNTKHRALRLDSGSFSWGSQNITRRARIVDVVFNASNNELVRTKVLTKNTIVWVDAVAFKEWFQTKYNVTLRRAKEQTEASTLNLEPVLEDAIASGRVLACISSRPGQSGRADGYVLEGKQLDFYRKQIQKKKK